MLIILMKYHVLNNTSKGVNQLRMFSLIDTDHLCFAEAGNYISGYSVLIHVIVTVRSFMD